MKTLVCKYSQAFIEPCFEQYPQTGDENAVLFSSSVWHAYAFLKRELPACDYFEIADMEDPSLADLLDGYTHVVFFCPFPKTRRHLARNADFVRMARDKGIRVVHIGKTRGFGELLREDRLWPDVHIHNYDIVGSLRLLVEDGFFKREGATRGMRVVGPDDIPPVRYLYEGVTYLDLADEIGRWDYRSLPHFRKQRVITSGSGCPHGCRFCNKRRTKPMYAHPVTLAHEIAFWGGLPLDLQHHNLFFDREWMEVFFEELAKFPPNQSIRTTGRIDDLYRHRDLFPYLKQIGVDCIDVGLESANARVLENMNKTKNDLGELEVIFQKLQDLGIQLQMNLLLGMPEEDEESIAETFELFKRYRSSANFSLLRPTPGTPVYDEVLENKLADQTSLGLIEHLKSLEGFVDSQAHVPTKYMSMEQLSQWHHRFNDYRSAHCV